MEIFYIIIPITIVSLCLVFLYVKKKKLPDQIQKWAKSLNIEVIEWKK